MYGHITLAGCDGTFIGASTAPGAGQANTPAIVIGCSEAGIAARLCDDLILNGYNDWFLPSKDELNQMYINKNEIGSFANYYYWSSSEPNHGFAAWREDFTNGFQTANYNKTYLDHVRAVRAFYIALP